jgi:hypothetical protein
MIRAVLKAPILCADTIGGVSKLISVTQLFIPSYACGAQLLTNAKTACLNGKPLNCANFGKMTPFAAVAQRVHVVVYLIDL